LDSGTKLRGDINCLLLGDPSTAKSQLLRAVMNLAPLAISTTGKGSSGVGLTAAVTTDADTKERRLEAGAMVLADRGIVLIDEFDKMSESDRVSIHEAMEQQTITIAKAGMYASLNARCSVLAAANPVYGQYDRARRVQENIGLPDSLLSRFDLLFVVLDTMDPEHDRSIAGHVLAGHRYRKTNYADNGMDPDAARYDIDMEDDENEENEDVSALSAVSKKKQGIWQRSHHSKKDDAQDVLNQDFLRKYLHYAKTRVQPVLSEEAREAIANKYAEMRSRQDERTLPVTARSLETIIRLASAHAKARLSPIVNAETDVANAMEILAFALYHEHEKGTPKISAASVNASNAEEPATVSETDTDNDQDYNSDAASQNPQNKKARTNANESDLQVIQQRIWEDVRASGGDVALADICTDIDEDLKMKAVQKMEDQVMESEGILYLI